MIHARFSLTEDDLILSVNPGHDGAAAVVSNGRLISCLVAEHDSRPRHMPTSAYFLLDSLMSMPKPPAVIAKSGWGNEFPFQSAGTAYRGTDPSKVTIEREQFCGFPTLLFESTHELAHVYCSYGMSPFPAGEHCYALVWEGNIGDFYEIDENVNIRQLGSPVQWPGFKYSYLYDLADPTVKVGTWRLENAGKLMALAGLSCKETPSYEEAAMVNHIIDNITPSNSLKSQFSGSRYLDCGVTDEEFVALVKFLSDELFDRFYEFAKQRLTKGYPLIISGGCGLNCDWNSRWKDSGLFRDVFVPPVTNDSGIAIGTAVEAQHMLLGNPKVTWTVYSGAQFTMDNELEWGQGKQADDNEIAELLLRGNVIAWVQGNAEIGPRALGHRSLLAAPFRKEIKDRLNDIKKREWYRPVAPVCLAEDALELFELKQESPYMLYFSRVGTRALEAVTHADDSARVQTVNRAQNVALYSLLQAFKVKTGHGVLCNTSLNWPGKGFINRSSDLLRFCVERKIDACVINSRLYYPIPAIDATGAGSPPS